MPTMRWYHPLRRTLTLFLAASLALPGPALALRQNQPETEQQRAGLEDALRAGMEEAFRTPEAAIRYLLMNPANESFVNRMEALADARRLLGRWKRPLERTKVTPFLRAAEQMDRLGGPPAVSSRPAVAYGRLHARPIAQVAHDRYFSKLATGQAAELLPLVRVLAEAARDAALPRRHGPPSWDAHARIESFIRVLPDLAHQHLRPWVEEWNAAGRLLPLSPAVPPLRALAGRLFNMDGEEARRVLAWAVGRLSLERGREYLAFGQTRTLPNAPAVLLAHVLPNTDRLRSEVAAPGLKRAGHSVAVTGLLRSPSERGVPLSASKEQMPWLLYRYYEDPASGEKRISVYRIPPGVSPILDSRQDLFEQLSKAPTAYVGEILINLPADLDAEPASNRHLLVMTRLEALFRDFLRESVSLAKARALPGYPGRAAFPLADGGLDTFWSELERAGVTVQRGVSGREGLKPRLARLTQEGEWTHLVLRREVRQRPKGGITHFLIRGTLGHPGETGEWVESPLELIVVLASAHQQWGGKPVALQPLLGAWTVGLMDALEITPSHRQVTVRTLSQMEFTTPAGVPPASGASKWQWVVDTPLKSYVGVRAVEDSAARQLLGFYTPDQELLDQEGWHSTHQVAMAERQQDSVQRPLAFYEDDSGDKWVGVWGPGTSTSSDEPTLWIRVSRRDVITEDVKDIKSRISKAFQHARMEKAAQAYLKGEKVGDVPIRVRMAINPSALPVLKDRTFSARLWVWNGPRASAPVVAILSASEVPAGASGKQFFLTTPQIPILPGRSPFLRAVGDSADPDSGVTVHVWLDLGGRYQVRINQLPPELRRVSELAADVLTERGLSLEEARTVAHSLERNTSDPLHDYALGKASVLDVNRLDEIPAADKIEIQGSPLVLIPRMPLAVPGKQAGVLVSPTEAVAVTEDQFSRYRQIAASTAAGLEASPQSKSPQRAQEKKFLEFLEDQPSPAAGMEERLILFGTESSYSEEWSEKVLSWKRNLMSISY